MYIEVVLLVFIVPKLYQKVSFNFLYQNSQHHGACCFRNMLQISYLLLFLALHRCHKSSLKAFHLFIEVTILAFYLSIDAMVLGGLCRYCLNCSSKAWPMVLMTLWAKPSEHSRMWHAEGDRKEKKFFPAPTFLSWLSIYPTI